MERGHSNPLNQQECLGAWQLINQVEKITLLTHRNPDADGISACAALARVLEAQGKQIEAVYPTAPELVILRQPEIVFINEHRQLPDLLIVCDTANSERAYLPQAFAGIPLINIDHHISNSIQATFNFVDGQASSACEVLYFFMQHAGRNVINKEVAECLLFGILYDTQVFQIPSTAPRTLRIAAELIEQGVVLSALITELLAHKNPEIIAFWGKLLSTVSYNQHKTAAWIIITQNLLKEHGLTLASLTGLSNFLSTIALIDVAIIFYELEDGGTKVSLRSRHHDVNALAKNFGGGGHKNAAGITTQQSVHEIVAAITQLL